MQILLHNLTAATMSLDGPYGLIEDAAILIEDGKIAWVGHQMDAPKNSAEPIDLEGRTVTPALIDCHTHLIYGGNRAKEFEMRLLGASYEEIARAGGGINSTVSATRNASEDELVALALPRLDALLAEGVSTIEIKSGYGLSLESELSMLRAARRLATLRPVRIKTSFLAAHAVPKEYAGQADTYIDDVCIPALTSAHAEGLVDAVDGFCEGIAFTTDQISRVFDAAEALKLPVKLHAEQLSHMGGTQLASSRGALSADHLEYAMEEDAKAMAESGTVATILPGAYYTLRETKQPPIQAFRTHGVDMAVATDANPGSSPMCSLLLAMNMACTMFKMTPEETLRGATINAARALGLTDCGTLTKGNRADLAIWNISYPSELAYRIGFNPLHSRVFNGKHIL
ncbi:imidazolonepropionase [Lentilitoribacter sp. EG35]|uniref:imidazolonepropionase n=1 Tax=Lentilitoribacter sp. EG35 TaxID=3234192 RepID=UPI003460F931